MVLDTLKQVTALSAIYRIEFEADDGTWVDFNREYPGGMPDYWSCLGDTEPNITVKAEGARRHQYVATVDVLTMDNRPWLTRDYGFWDAPLPVTIKRDGGTYVFSGWRKRRVRIRLALIDTSGGIHSTTSLGIWRVADVDRKSTTAAVSLVSLNKTLIDAKADTVKDGDAWYKGMTITALITLLARAADPSMSLGSELSAGQALDLGTFTTPRVTSWGSAPGVRGSGMASNRKWITRCAAPKPSSSVMAVGFECPVAAARPGGGMGSFDLATGRWSIVFVPTVTGMTDKIPIAVYVSGTTAYFAAMREITPSTSVVAWYELYFYRVTLAANQTPTQIGSQSYFWPAREVIRAGHPLAGTDPYYCGWDQVNNKFYSEPILCPFPQVIENFSAEINGGPYQYNVAQWTAYRSQDTFDGAGGHDYAHLQQNMPVGPDNIGAYRGFCDSSVFQTYCGGSWRQFMGSDVQPPIAYKFGGVVFWHWVGHATTPGTAQQFVKRQQVDADVTEYWTMGAMGGYANREVTCPVTAYGLLQAGGAEREAFMVACIEWSDTDTASIPWSIVRLGIFEWTGIANAGAGAWSDLWTYTPSGADAYKFAPVFVRIWTPTLNSDEYGSPKDFSLVVVCNRGDVTGTPYSVGVFAKKAGVRRWIQLGGRAAGAAPEPEVAYAGPWSALPFTGFATDIDDDNRAYFVDQASGFLYTVYVDPTTFAVTWGIANNGVPVHGSETKITTPVAARHTPAVDSLARYYWGAAPNLSGEIRLPHYSRAGQSSMNRMEAGTYPLLMFSTAVGDCVEVADFSGMTVMEAISQLAELAWKYRLYWDGNGSLRLTKRVAGTPECTLRRRSTEGESEPWNEILSYDDAVDVKVLEDEAYNSVQVTPYVLQVNKPETPQPISAVGSTFKGSYLYEVKNERPLRVSIICVSGGELLTGWNDNTTNAILFRWAQIPSTVSCLLLYAVGATDRTVKVGNLKVKGTKAFAGDQEVTIGDYVTVRGGNRNRITNIDPLTLADAVTLTIDGDAGPVGFSAPSWSEVIIQPAGGAIASDGPTGVGVLQSQMLTGATTLIMREGSRVVNGMVVEVQNEKMIVTAVAGTTVTVTRGQFGSTQNTGTIPAGAVVKGFLWIRQKGLMGTVGDTGVRFGLSIDDEAEMKDRTISVGDGVLIVGNGMSLVKAEHAMIKAQNNQAIKRTQLFEYAMDNRFVDPVRGELYANTILTENVDPKTKVSNMNLPLVPGLGRGLTVTLIDRRAIPGGASVLAEIIEQTIRKKDASMRLVVLTFSSYSPGKTGGTTGTGEVIEEGTE